jgi:hypothetical protein
MASTAEICLSLRSSPKNIPLFRAQPSRTACALVYIWNFERDAAPLIEAALRDYELTNSTVIIRSREAASQLAALRN